MMKIQYKNKEIEEIKDHFKCNRNQSNTHVEQMEELEEKPIDGLQQPQKETSLKIISNRNILQMVSEFLTTKEVIELSRCNKNLYKTLKDCSFVYQKGCQELFTDLENQNCIFYITEIPTKYIMKAIQNDEWKSMFMNSRIVLQNFQNFQNQKLKIKNDQQIVKCLFNAIKEPCIPAGELKRNCLGVQKTTFSNHLVDYKIREQRSKNYGYTGHMFGNRNAMYKDIKDILSKEFFSKMLQNETYTPQDKEQIIKMRLYELKNIKKEQINNSNIGNIIQLYNYLQKIIIMKCQVDKKLIESHDTPESFFIDFCEKWNIFSCFISYLEKQFKEFDDVIEQLYRTIKPNSEIPIKFSIWRLATKIYVQTVFKPLKARVEINFKEVLQKVRSQRLEDFIQYKKDKQLKLKFKQNKQQVSRFFKDNEESFYLLIHVISAIEDVCTNEISVYTKLVDENNKCSYEAPYSDLLRVFYQGLGEFYKETFSIFEEFNPELFFQFIQKENQKWANCFGLYQNLKIQNYFQSIIQKYLRHKVLVTLLEQDSLGNFLQDSSSQVQNLETSMLKGKNSNVEKLIENFLNRWFKKLQIPQKKLEKIMEGLTIEEHVEQMQIEDENKLRNQRINAHLEFFRINSKTQNQRQQLIYQMKNYLQNNCYDIIEQLVKIDQVGADQRKKEKFMKMSQYRQFDMIVKEYDVKIPKNDKFKHFHFYQSYKFKELKENGYNMKEEKFVYIQPKVEMQEEYFESDSDMEDFCM